MLKFNLLKANSYKIKDVKIDILNLIFSKIKKSAFEIPSKFQLPIDRSNVIFLLSVSTLS